MKLNIFFVLTVAACTISATNFDTNAQRMARGFPPLPPVRRATPVIGTLLFVLVKEPPLTFHHHQSCEKGSSIWIAQCVQYWISPVLYVLLYTPG